jgi:hypothetical protein
MKLKIFTLFLFALSTAFAQQTEIDFTNNKVPLYPGCKDMGLRYDCFVKGIGALVCDSVNGYHKVHPFTEESLQVVLSVVTKESGEIMLLSAKSGNVTVRDIAYAALDRLPKVVPIFSPQGYPVSASVGFVVVLKKNNTGLFVHEYTSRAEEWLAKPSPMPMPVFDAVFPGCEGVKSAANCFGEKCNEWLVPKLSAVATSEIKNNEVLVRVTVNEEGKLDSYEFFNASEALKKEAETVMKSFPKVTPSTVCGAPYRATYVFPVKVKS